MFLSSEVVTDSGTVSTGRSGVLQSEELFTQSQREWPENAFRHHTESMFDHILSLPQLAVVPVPSTLGAAPCVFTCSGSSAGGASSSSSAITVLASSDLSATSSGELQSK